MSSWAERVHRRAADLSSVVTSCGHPGSSTPSYPYRLEKVKFGVSLEEVCKINNNIPGPLLVLILKLNKESPNKRDVFRAPGHQGAMKKLIHFLQSGRLVNVDNYSVYTIASVLKKFLRKIPNGIFGRMGEKELFAINELENEMEQSERLHRLFASLPKYTQHLLVLLFGTFRVIASNAIHAGTGMTSEALGVSVAPSFFQSCVSDGKTAKMEDVLKFKVATKIMQHIIDKFATHDLFGRENYEYYARVTGRILKVQDEWICSFQYPPPPRGKLAQQKYALQHSLEAEKTWLQCQCERWGLLAQEESRSTPALLTSSSSALENSVLSLGMSPEHSFIESCARLSVSLEGPSLFAMSSSPLPKKLNLGTEDNDYDEENYADDDEEYEDDFSAELELCDDDGGLQKMCKDKRSSELVKLNADNVVNLNQTYDDGIVNMRRRYRQNKKKMATKSTQIRSQHQRRFRGGSKSLDGGERIAPQNAKTLAVVMTSTTANEPHNGQKINSTRTNSSNKTRICNRCNRDVRHSSSCSLKGSNNGSNSNMTMDELRAVNRYAESTKSLSYLPQVHERQTARMRTRSEWFLSPRGPVFSITLPESCNSCYNSGSSHHNHQYLGGGSTRDIRNNDSNSENEHEQIRNTNKMLYQYSKTEQQRQDSEFPERMEIEESLIFRTDLQHSTSAFITPKQRLIHSGRPKSSGITLNRLFLDPNNVGNIRLSNSAESMQYSLWRPTNRRLLINVPRHYPIRSSQRRYKEKQINSICEVSQLAQTNSTEATLPVTSEQKAPIHNSVKEHPNNLKYTVQPLQMLFKKQQKTANSAGNPSLTFTSPRL